MVERGEITQEKYIKRLTNLTKWVRERQDTERGMVTFHEVSQRYKVPLDVVMVMVQDANLSYNVGVRTGAGVGVYERRSEYLIEDLNVEIPV